MVDWKVLSECAWRVGKRARLAPGGKTQVGCAVSAGNGEVFVGCNTQHKWRCDIHAEVAAIAAFCSHSAGKIVAVLIAAPRHKFTPCGACMDWIFEIGGPDCEVAYQNDPEGEIKTFKASQLMPEYPG